MFQLVKEAWLPAVKHYCMNKPLETLEITFYLTHYYGKAHQFAKRSGHLYCSMQGDVVTGVAFFNAMHIMYISYEDEDMFKKVDFLKTIHKEQPQMIRGPLGQVDRVFYFLQRALKSFSFQETKLMAYLGHELPLEGLVPIDAEKANWQQNTHFLLEVEQVFREQSLSVNRIRSKISGQIDFDRYLVAQLSDRVVGQVICEFSTFQHGVIGGLYVKPVCRGKGLAKSLMAMAINTYLEEDLTPVLYVKRDNKEAVSLYHEMGLVDVMDMMDMTISL